MTVSAPVVAPAFAPDEEPEPSQPAAPARTRTGRHEPIRSSMPRIVGRGAALGLTVAAGVAGGHYLRNDLNAGLVAGPSSARWPPAWRSPAPGRSAGA
jgi:hypothetical protein